MLTIVDYGIGNLSSIQNMLKKAGTTAIISGEEEEISQATQLILPGMGHFDNCMKKFNASGLRPTIEKKIINDKIPLLGICVGLQMLMQSSEEGEEEGLGWIKGKTLRFNPEKMGSSLKIPHMGWEDLHAKKPSGLWEGLDGSRFYFAHSYYVAPDNAADILLTADYGYAFTAAVERENILGVQFHPEKSHRFGMRLLQNFANNYA